MSPLSPITKLSPIGARLEDYSVIIDGIPAIPIALTENRITVKIPDSRPTGETWVINYFFLHSEYITFISHRKWFLFG